MKKMRRFSAVLLAVIMVCSIAVPGFAAEKQEAASGTYIITNPYANVNWDTFKAYKTALHTHTNASDGDPTLKESIQRHVETGYDIVATTDHGTTNYTWETPCPNNLIHGALSLVGKSEGDLVYLGKEGTFDNGVSYTYSTNAAGDDMLVTDSGRTIMRVPFGIENNAVSVNAHVNSFFVDYHNNFVTTYVDAVKGVQKLGGVSVINHPGEYSKARYELHSADAYNTDNIAYWYFVNKIASLLSKYDTCIGVDVNSKGDGRTRFDRVFWDVLLQRFADNGQNVYAIGSSDAHQLNKIDTGFTLALMPEFSNAALEKALRSGEFFAASHCIGNYEELVAIQNGINEFYGQTELYNTISAVTAAMEDRVAKIENGEMDADEDIGITYDVLDDQGYCTAATEPAVTSIKVDDEADTITVNTENALIVRWISNGEQIACQKADSATLSLGEFGDKLGNYVRAEVFGEGGVIYTQAFLLNAADNAGKSAVVDKGFFDIGILDFLIPQFKNWFDILGRLFA